MYHLMQNLPVIGTLGVVSLLAGPLARLPIDLGAWLLELLVRWNYETGPGTGSGSQRVLPANSAGRPIGWNPNGMRLAEEGNSLFPTPRPNSPAGSATQRTTTNLV
jgi:hypothetical protein